MMNTAAAISKPESPLAILQNHIEKVFVGKEQWCRIRSPVFWREAIFNRRCSGVGKTTLALSSPSQPD